MQVLKGKDVLYLASQSPARKGLLDQAMIPYLLLDHTSDEVVCSQDLDFCDYVLTIAQHKMQHVLLPDINTIDKNYIFVLTADSLVRSTKTNEVLGKPIDKADAQRMLSSAQRGSVEVATGCCLEKKIKRDGVWDTDDKRHWVTSALVEFYVHDKFMEDYFKNAPDCLHSSGAGIIDRFGVNFLKSVNGSYTAVVGLPIFELRGALHAMNFFF